MTEQTPEEAFQSLIDKGLMEIKGVDENGELTFGLTELGEKVGKKMQEEEDGWRGD